jgi:hypothetical protein
MTVCEYTRAKLEKLGVTCARIDRKLIETYVRAGIREGYFPMPTNVDERRRATNEPADDFLQAAANVGASSI